jgi:hypothetical protein
MRAGPRPVSESLQNPPHRSRRNCRRRSAEGALSTHFQISAFGICVAFGLAWRKTGDSSTFSRVPTPRRTLCRPDVECPRPPRRSQRRPLPSHCAPPPVATSRHHRTPRRATGDWVRELSEVRFRPRLCEASFWETSYYGPSPSCRSRPRPLDAQRTTARSGQPGWPR